MLGLQEHKSRVAETNDFKQYLEKFEAAKLLVSASFLNRSIHLI